MKIIQLSKGQKTTVDDEDFGIISRHKWCFSVRGYAVSRINKKVIYLHRFILKVSDPKVKIDHANRNQLDNRKSNLRLCTTAQNIANSGLNKKNTSGYKGVFMVPEYVHKSKRWCAMYRHKNLGYFSTPKEAAERYNKEIKELYGEFAYQN